MTTETGITNNKSFRWGMVALAITSIAAVAYPTLDGFYIDHQLKPAANELLKKANAQIAELCGADLKHVTNADLLGALLPMSSFTVTHLWPRSSDFRGNLTVEIGLADQPNVWLLAMRPGQKDAPVDQISVRECRTSSVFEGPNAM